MTYDMTDEDDICTCTVTRDDVNNTVVIDPTGCTYSGHFDPPFELFLTGEARDAFIEGVVIGALKSMRDIDEPLVRARWRAMSADTPLRNAVLQIVGHNGQEYEIVLATLEEALGAI